MARAFVTGWVSLVVLAVGAGDAAAQSRQSVDSAFARAQRLQGAAGRLLVDSVLTTLSPDSSMMYAEGLYWRARLTTVDRDAEQDYRRIVVEFPMSPRSGDALLALSHLEQARGEGEAAAAHLRRFLLENPGRTEDGRTALSLSQLLFDQHNPEEACATLLPAHERTPDSAAELKNQMEYLLPRCRGVDTSAHRSVTATPGGPPVANASTAVAAATPPPPATGTNKTTTPPPKPATTTTGATKGTTTKTTTTKSATTKGATTKSTPAKSATTKDTASKDTTTKDTSAKSTATKAATTKATATKATTTKPATPPVTYTVQVGAFDTHPEANATAAHLTDLGMEAHVVGTTKPFRVQVGRFTTRAEADSLSEALKAKKITNFVTTVGSGG